ncbi:acetate--CoA ligase family protein [Limobrevibacterium gyesilva]|uniref:Acetate--CoA ligase family protein n=1 Tax=Limobrevibacterium gyesilva TaxID=2991712 RepID=A0AA41YQE6_9PROT|nr:acetate--CoA ligase family protein [Limobrevibacterium gyesilva]MCW3476955.1 acetate--CoA ligase family protein [Limobrevibacterium gyesilva]
MSLHRGLYRHADLARLLHPASVAIVGATPRPGAFGERVLANLAPFYGGRIHLVNARYEQVGDRRCHPSLSALPEVPDCVMIAVAREAVEPVVEECIALGVGGVIVFASGYAETGKPGRAEQQERLADMARRARMPLIGPNCIGVNNYALRARITFMPPADIPSPRPGAIGVVSQSGALGFGFEQAAFRGVSVSHLLTSGNSCDVDMADFVAYLADDPACSAIALLFEGMAEPMRLIEAAGLAWAAGKPVVACKLAVGEFGAQAAMSYTGSLAGSQAAYRAAFERAGVVLVDNVEALMEAACFLAKAPPPTSRGVAVLATSGGAAIMAADKAEAHGVPMPQPGPAARAVLEARIPEFGSTRNPVDLTAQVLNDPECLPACANALMDDPAFGALVIPMVYATAQTATRLPVYADIARRSGKPVIVVWVTDWLEGPGSAAFEQSPDVVLFRSMDRAYAAIAAWHRRGERLAAPPREVVRRAPAAAAAPAAALLAQAQGRALTEREAKAVLALYGIPVVQERLAHSADDAASAAEALGLPAVLKVESPDLPHKTEAGVIRLNLRNADAVRAAYDAVMANAARVSPPPRINGVLVQPMVPEGVEVMVGARVDPLFGPLVVVGLGGVLVELLQDTAVGLAPLTHAEALALLEKLKGAAALRGFRGSAPVDLDRLADLVGRVCELVADHRASVAEIDVNPLICAGSRILAVDALIVKNG